MTYFGVVQCGVVFLDENVRRKTVHYRISDGDVCNRVRNCKESKEPMRGFAILTSDPHRTHGKQLSPLILS